MTQRRGPDRVLSNAQRAGFDQLSTQQKVTKSARRLLQLLFEGHLDAHYGGLAAWFRTRVDSQDPVYNGVNFNAQLNNQKKETAVGSLKLWSDTHQKALWTQQLSALRGGLQRVRPEQDLGNGWGQGGVHCAVYVKTNQGLQKIGDDYTAQEGDRRDDHAEMQWKNAHTNAFDQQLANGSKAEFHISKVCCEEWCSERMIQWWAARNPPNGFEGAYIYTYQDEQGGKHIYQLFCDSIVQLGTWG